MLSSWRPVPCILLLLLLASYVPAQKLGSADRLSDSFDPSQVVHLPANKLAARKVGVDLGPVEVAFSMPYITLTFAPSAREQANLKKFLSEQQDPASHSYHQWLTPEQYADRFGLSVHETQVLARWLQNQGFSILQTARGRNWIAFSGTAGQVRSAFHTDTHRYSAKGRIHFANAEEPSIPREFQGGISGYRGLADFGVSSLPASNRHVSHAESTTTVKANDTIVTTNPDDGTVTISHALAPDDVATIYNLTPYI